jgi:hypothetical protein
MSRFAELAASVLRRRFGDEHDHKGRLAHAFDQVIDTRITTAAPLFEAAGVEEDCFTLEVLIDVTLAGLEPGKVGTDVLNDRQTLLLLRAMIHRLELAVREIQVRRTVRGIR